MAARVLSTIASPAEPVNPESQARRSSARRHIFVLILIGARNQKSIKSETREFGAQSRNSGRALRGIRQILEGLIETFEHLTWLKRTYDRIRHSTLLGEIESGELRNASLRMKGNIAVQFGDHPAILKFVSGALVK